MKAAPSEDTIKTHSTWNWAGRRAKNKKVKRDTGNLDDGERLAMSTGPVWYVDYLLLLCHFAWTEAPQNTSFAVHVCPIRNDISFWHIDSNFWHADGFFI